MATTADSDKILVSRSGSPIYGRTDGIGVLPDAAGTATTTDGLVAVANGVVCKTLEPSMLCEVFEDFLGAAALVLETEASASARGATVIGEVLGGASCSEAEGLFAIRDWIWSAGRAASAFAISA